MNTFAMFPGGLTGLMILVVLGIVLFRLIYSLTGRRKEEFDSTTNEVQE